MKKGIARLLIQLFADESETTDLEMDVTEEENAENSTEDAENDAEETEETPLPVEEPTEEPEKVKTFTQEEVNEIVKERLKRETKERKKLDREYREQLSKYEELAYLTQEGLKASNLEETLEKSRSFYGKQGIKYQPANSTREDEIVANAYAREIIEDSDSIEEIKAAADKLLKKGTSITNREKLIVQGLIGEMESRERISSLKKLGVKEEVYNSDEFKAFEKKFTKDTPISDVYELYRTMTKPTAKVVENPGSMKSIPAKEKKAFITEAEYDRMTDKEIEENIDLIKLSMAKW